MERFLPALFFQDEAGGNQLGFYQIGVIGPKDDLRPTRYGMVDRKGN